METSPDGDRADPAPRPGEAGEDRSPHGGTATLLLVRHGLTSATGSTLSGRAPGFHLDERGREQAAALGARLAGTRLDAIVSSPLERCVETARAIASASQAPPPLTVDDRFEECDYGEWTGRTLGELARDPLWPTVQNHPSAARFPGGESLAESAQRAVSAVRDHNARLLAEHAAPVYLVCSHGDIIKTILADALGAHLDQFQRILVDPCSLSVVRYTPLRPFLVRVNDLGGSTAGLAPPVAASADAVVGGGAGEG
ncbi:MSMEG_4193 family putative phosphomutase [Actinorugispora endophytica]|uniref:Putative phosphoglycerate mutase n=1 Tax=Actinorugispora endophytica TaxID=1605990 RepID=A0A4R6UIG9_9ACTN|nr:MSMEG_4193 family putative phosphomutase [Actinorugispora endophytica]TDQ45856.1 putative phosphoglycerate mutase [Actinorugispora endophytica]